MQRLKFQTCFQSHSRTPQLLLGASRLDHLTSHVGIIATHALECFQSHSRTPQLLLGASRLDHFTSHVGINATHALEYLNIIVSWNNKASKWWPYWFVILQDVFRLSSSKPTYIHYRFGLNHLWITKLISRSQTITKAYKLKWT